MLIVVHYCYRFLCTVVTDSCALLLPFFVHSPYHFLCTRDFCLQQSISINRQDVSTSINTQMDALIPPSKISGLTQGMFVGSVSDNFNERIEQKIFHCEIVVDAEKVKREESAYKKIPVITNFTDEDGNDRMKETVQANYRRIKEEVKQIVQEELERIKNDPVLCKLLPDNETV